MPRLEIQIREVSSAKPYAESVFEAVPVTVLTRAERYSLKEASRDRIPEKVLATMNSRSAISAVRRIER